MNLLQEKRMNEMSGPRLCIFADVDECGPTWRLGRQGSSVVSYGSTDHRAVATYWPLACVRGGVAVAHYLFSHK
jgi:hypothetical protein